MPAECSMLAERVSIANCTSLASYVVRDPVMAGMQQHFRMMVRSCEDDDTMRTIPEHESLTIEFKSDAKRLPDRELVETVVCLANSEGGHIYVGVEDDGRITGLQPEHRDVAGMAAMIANRTNPPLTLTVELLGEDGKHVAHVEVPKSTRLIATSDGLVQRRRIQAHGTPQCVPFYPHEFISRQSDLRQVDYSALPVAGATTADFDPLERERLRQLVGRYNGDRALVGLDDDELHGALGLVETEGGRRVPTGAALCARTWADHALGGCGPVQGQS